MWTPKKKQPLDSMKSGSHNQILKLCNQNRTRLKINHITHSLLRVIEIFFFYMNVQYSPWWKFTNGNNSYHYDTLPCFNIIRRTSTTNVADANGALSSSVKLSNLLKPSRKRL